MTCLVCLLLIAVIMDLKSYKISNLLIIFGVILGIIFNYCEQGRTSISLWFFGMLLPILLLFPLFLMKALGAGDIKLFSVVGCFCGAAFVYHSIGAAFVIAAFFSLLHLIKYRFVLSGFHFFQSFFQDLKSEHSSKAIQVIQKYCERKRGSKQSIIRFSPAILAAVLINVFFDY